MNNMTQFNALGFTAAELEKLIFHSVEKAVQYQFSKHAPTKTEFLSVKAAAAYLQLSVSTVYAKTAASELPHMKRGNKLYFEKDQLDAWLREGRQQTRQDAMEQAANYTYKRKGGRNV
ncbi:helix-turn-helix domain-containing protein [Cesiribacter andamanensis]|uniref:DNA binding domain, excisionase family n=1 Tax=Cesiribacter andamanensis AMV16 TaxID=1279009 RepID=M7NSL8_9BACT|nr:helix-turn-helix domain-containing protein [Cesiribacter andamanensis]EMR04685.1 DNA binding domain, excisionase family [Cesiribacter andamanensis AMV16]